MSAHRLSFSTEPKVQPVQPGDIEVPPGESHFQVTTEGEYAFHLRHPLSRALITGLVDVSEGEPRLVTRTIHHAPQTQAETIIKAIVQGTGKPRYEGVIAMEQEAQNSESYLSHHALLLGEQAKSWALPSLEIKANQVKCSHSATVRTITDLDLFYLRSRGIGEVEAINALVEAFKAQ